MPVVNCCGSRRALRPGTSLKLGFGSTRFLDLPGLTIPVAAALLYTAQQCA